MNEKLWKTSGNIYIYFNIYFMAEYWASEQIYCLGIWLNGNGKTNQYRMRITITNASILINFQKIWERNYRNWRWYPCSCGKWWQRYSRYVFIIIECHWGNMTIKETDDKKKQASCFTLRNVYWKKTQSKKIPVILGFEFSTKSRTSTMVSYNKIIYSIILYLSFSHNFGPCLDQPQVRWWNSKFVKSNEQNSNSSGKFFSPRLFKYI